MVTIKELIQCLWADIKAYLGSNYQPKGSYASSNHNHNSAYLGIKAKAESAKSADSVVWGGVSGKPSTFTPSSHTHDDRYYTESEVNNLLGGKANTSHNHNSAYLGINAKASSSYTTDHISHQSMADNTTANTYCGNFWSDGSSVFGTGWGGWYSAFNSANQDYGSQIFVSEKSDRMFFRRLYGSKWYAPLEVIHSANIGSQSVNYANSAGSATNATYTNWLRTSSHADHLFHTDWDGTYFWTYVTASDGGYRAVRVARSDSSGYADNCGYSRLLATYADDGHYLCPDRYDGWNTRLYMTYGDKGVKADNVHVHHADYSSRSAGDGAFYISGYQIYVG